MRFDQLSNITSRTKWCHSQHQYPVTNDVWYRKLYTQLMTKITPAGWLTCWCYTVKSGSARLPEHSAVPVPLWNDGWTGLHCMALKRWLLCPPVTNVNDRLNRFVHCWYNWWNVLPEILAPESIWRQTKWPAVKHRIESRTGPWKPVRTTSYGRYWCSAPERQHEATWLCHTGK